MQLSVRKSNDLIEVGENLSKPAKLFVLYLIAKMPIDETEFREMSISYSDLKQIVNIDGRKRVSTIKEAERMMDELGKNPLKFENSEFQDMVTWFARKRFYKKKKVWHFKFHEELKPYLLHLKSQFTRYSFWYTVSLSSHAIKLYELMKRYEYLGTCEISISKQKYYLGIEQKYQEYYEYRRWVLDEAQKELEMYTDIKFRYEPAKKEGRRIVSHRFFIEENKPKVIVEPLRKVQQQQRLPFDTFDEEKPMLNAEDVLTEEHDEMMNDLQEWGGKKYVVKRLINKFGIDKVEYQHRHTKHVLEAGKIKKDNPFAWFRAALKGNYHDPSQERRRQDARQKSRRNQQAEQKRQLEEKLNSLRKEYYDQRKAIGDSLLNDQPELLDEMVNKLRGNLTIGMQLRDGKSPEEIYQSRMTAGLILTQIEKHFPNAFESVNTSFSGRIRSLEKKVRTA
ncbi:MAG: replication initiation protein [Bacteroidota bacterium]